MATFDPEKARAYVNELDLGESSERVGLMAEQEAAPLVSPREQDQPSAALDAGALVSFVSGVGTQQRNDVLDSFLLAELAADAVAERNTDTERWYEKFGEVLENVGWVTQALEFSSYSTDKADFSVADAILAVLAAGLTGNEVALLKAALEAAKALDDDEHRLTLFDRDASSLKHGSLLAAVATSSNGALAVKTGAVHFDANTQVDRVLVARFSRKTTTMSTAHTELTLDTHQYSRVRDAVNARLASRSPIYVANVPLPPLPTAQG